METKRNDGFRSCTSLSFDEQRYVAPDCVSVTLLNEGVLCASYGDEGAAGPDLGEEDSLVY